MSDSNPAWDSLTTEQQNEMLDLAQKGKSEGFSMALKVLYEAGYVDYFEHRLTGTIVFLTYRGAMIIPPSLVKGGD